MRISDGHILLNGFADLVSDDSRSTRLSNALSIALYNGLLQLKVLILCLLQFFTLYPDDVTGLAGYLIIQAACS
jgi:hypothetical protein